jgi:hypothetical protein
MRCTVDNNLRIQNNLLKADAEEGPKGPPAMLVEIDYRDKGPYSNSQSSYSNVHTVSAHLNVDVATV